MNVYVSSTARNRAYYTRSLEKILLPMLFFLIPFYEKPCVLFFDLDLFGISFVFKPVYLAAAAAFAVLLLDAGFAGRIKDVLSPNKSQLFMLLLLLMFLMVPEFLGNNISGKRTFIIIVFNSLLVFLIPLLIREESDIVTALVSFVLGTMIYSSAMLVTMKGLRTLHEGRYGLGLSFSFFMCIFMVVYGICRNRKILARTFILFTAVNIMLLVLDRSRSAWVGIFSGFSLLAIYALYDFFRYGNTISRRLLMVVLCVAVYFTAAVSTSNFAKYEFRSLYKWAGKDLTSTFHPGDHPIDPEVKKIHSTVLRRFLFFMRSDRTVPWRIVFTEYFPGLLFAGRGVNFDVYNGIHSVYLKIITSAGMTGFLTFVMFIIFIFRALAGKMRDTRDSVIKCFYLAIACSTVNWLVHGAAAMALIESSIWMVLGLALVVLDGKNGLQA